VGERNVAKQNTDERKQSRGRTTTIFFFLETKARITVFTIFLSLLLLAILHKSGPFGPACCLYKNNSGCEAKEILPLKDHFKTKRAVVARIQGKKDGSIERTEDDKE
jgi:ABC-type tungstate transport system substrate-binding protein